MEDNQLISQELQDKIQELENKNKELESLKDQYLRLNADFQNAQKRMSKEKEQWSTMLQSDILRDLLLVVDDFDRAKEQYKNIHTTNSEIESIITGLDLVYKTLTDFLIKKGVTEIIFTKNFDPELHEAISQIESQDEQSGQIISYLSNGYKYKDSILRPAKVSVCK